MEARRHGMSSSTSKPREAHTPIDADVVHIKRGRQPRCARAGQTKQPQERAPPPSSQDRAVAVAPAPRAAVNGTKKIDATRRIQRTSAGLWAMREASEENLGGVSTARLPCQKGASRSIAPGTNEYGPLSHCARYVFLSHAMTKPTFPP